MMKNSEETFQDLQHNFVKLNEENKRLRLKARSIDVLNNLLENSQDENKQLKEHILELQSKEDTTQGQFLDHSETSSGGLDNACRDLFESVDPAPRYVSSINDEAPLTDQPPTEREPEVPEDIKVLQQNVQAFQTENLQLSEEVKTLSESLSRQDIGDDDGEVIASLVQLRAKVQKYEKETHTRESFFNILANEKQTLDSKINDAISDKDVVVTKLKCELDENKELLKKIKKTLHKSDVSDLNCSTESSSVTSISSNDESQHFVMVPRSLPEKVASLDVKDASPMQSIETPSTSHSMTSDYVVVQQLQQQVSTIKREKDELLNVNHQWDLHYRQIQSEKNREIAALQQQILRLTHDLDAAIVSEADKRKEFDRRWTSAQELIEREKQAKELQIQQKEALEDRMRQLETGLLHVQAQYEEEKHRNENLEGNVNRLTQTMSQWTPMPSLSNEQFQQPQEHVVNQVFQQQHPPIISPPQTILHPSAPALSLTRPPATPPTDASMPNQGGQYTPSQVLAQGVTVEQIEMLKQQISIYAEDFRTERADRERIQAEKEAMKEEMDVLKENLTALQQQLSVYEEDFKREKSDKERLQRQLRNMMQMPSPLEYAGEQQVTTQQIREQQRKLQEMMDKFNSPPRYNPAYARGNGFNDPSRQWMQARGPSQNSGHRRRYDDMFHGGDVVPDTDLDVKDGGEAAQERSLKCPHCGVQFKATHFDHYNNHVEGCGP